MKLLADTSGLLALFLRGDAHHAAAARWLKQTPEARFLMTDLVLGETVTRLAARAGPARAVAAADSLWRACATRSCSWTSPFCGAPWRR